MINTTNLDRIINSPDLPTLPVVAVELLEMTSRSDVELSEIAKIVEYDPAIATKILRTVNSSFYGLSRRVGNIRQALAYLGMETVKGLVLGFSLAQTIKGGNDVITFDFLDYWRRSIFSASAARRIGIVTRGAEPEEAFVAALVQDIGMVAMWQHFGDRYLQVIDMSGDNPEDLPEFERKYFGLDHAEVGAAMLEKWKFPSSIIESVRMHHAPEDERGMHEELRRTVRLATSVSQSLAQGALEGQGALRAYIDYAATLFELKRGTALGLLQSISDNADELSAMFDIETGEAADVDSLLEEADRIRREQNLANPGEDSRPPSDPWQSLGDRDAIEAIIQSTCDQHQGVALILVGVDNMREINREAGSRAGDLAMRRAAESIVRACREAAGDSAEVYRFVGAEMAVVLRGEFVLRADTLAERMRAAVRLAPLTDESVGMRAITASIGVATISNTGSGPETHDELLRAAMVALSEARRAGGDQVASYDDPQVERLAA